MRPTTEVEQGSFASTMNRYLAHLVSAAGGDRSGRWVEAQSGGARSRDYWSNLIHDRRAMNTNDLAIVAEVFSMSPYDFVRAARAWDSYALAASDDADWQRSEETGMDEP